MSKANPKDQEVHFRISDYHRFSVLWDLLLRWGLLQGNCDKRLGILLVHKVQKSVRKAGFLFEKQKENWTEPTIFRIHNSLSKHDGQQAMERIRVRKYFRKSFVSEGLKDKASGQKDAQTITESKDELDQSDMFFFLLIRIGEFL